MQTNLKFKILNNYFKLKLYWNRAHSYFSIPSDFIRWFFLISIWLSVTGINSKIIILLTIIALIVIFLTGYYDVKHRIVDLENSFNNQFNPELMGIYKKVK